jgi:hypothetical protein
LELGGSSDLFGFTDATSNFGGGCAVSRVIALSNRTVIRIIATTTQSPTGKLPSLKTRERQNVSELNRCRGNVCARRLKGGLTMSNQYL